MKQKRFVSSETKLLLEGTRDYLNISQNNLIRQIIALPKTCHMTSKISKDL